MALHLSQLKKNYTGPDGSVVSVIDIENLAIADGEQVALIGSSGSGKTTLLHMIAGIVAADTGQIEYELGGAEGRVDIAKLAEADRDVFRGSPMVSISQTPPLPGGFTALENVLPGMSFPGQKPDRGGPRRLLDDVGLSDRRDYKPEKLS